MKPVITSMLCVTLAQMLAAPLAEASSGCQSQARSIQSGQEEARVLEAERETLLEEVEAAGDEWEAAEATRNFGETEAAKADAAKQTYEALKADLISLEETLQEQVSELNAAVSTFNDRCATK